MIRNGLATVLLLLVFVAGCQRETSTVAVGIAIPSYVHAVAWIGEEGGHFKRAGIETKVEVMGGSAATMRTLIAEQIDIGLGGGDAVIKANAAGADLVILGSLVNRFYHRLVVRKGIANAEALRGKRIGLPFLGGPQDMAVKVALRDLGLSYEDDVDVVSLGKEFNRMAAIQKGEIDATTSQSPPSKLKELGLEVLVDLPAKDAHFPYIVVAVRRPWLAKHRGDAKAVLRGLCDATRDYRDNEERSLKTVAKHLGNADVDGAARERYQSSGPSLLSLPPTPDVDSLGAVLSLLGDAKTDAATLVDASVLQEVIAEGHCQ